MSIFVSIVTYFTCLSNIQRLDHAEIANVFCETA